MRNTADQLMLLREEMVMSTGPEKEKLPPSRTKLIAVHAGLSPPMPPSKVPISLPVKPSTCQSNNSLTAPDHMETKDAMVDGWTLPSNTSLITDLSALLIIPMSLEIKLVPSQLEDNGKLKDSLMFRAVPTSRMP